RHVIVVERQMSALLDQLRGQKTIFFQPGERTIAFGKAVGDNPFFRDLRRQSVRLAELDASDEALASCGVRRPSVAIYGEELIPLRAFCEAVEPGVPQISRHRCRSRVAPLALLRLSVEGEE